MSEKSMRSESSGTSRRLVLTGAAALALAGCKPKAKAADPAAELWRSWPVEKRLEHALVPWSGFLVVPLFGFANAGGENRLYFNGGSAYFPTMSMNWPLPVRFWR